MHESQSKAPKNGNSDGAGESECASCGDLATSAHAQMMPAYALGQGVPGVSLFGSTVQPKRTVGQPDDPFEKEAETAQLRQAISPTTTSVASSKEKEEPSAQRGIDEQKSPEPQPEPEAPEKKEVAQLRGPSGVLSLKTAEDSKVAQKKADDEEETWLGSAQPRAQANHGHVLMKTGSGPALLERSDAEAFRPRIPKGNGQPISPEHRIPFEQALNHSLDHVRIHTDSSADRAARGMNADAFTIRSDIYFSDRAYSPGTPHGDRVLAHELTHVVQHEEGSIPESTSGDSAVSQPTDPLEVEAYAQEGTIAHDVGVLRGAAAPAIAAAAPDAAPPAAALVTRRTEGDTAGPTTTPGAQPIGQTSKAPEDASYADLIPPVPEQPSPLKTNAPPTEAPSLAEVGSRVAQPAPAPAAPAASAATRAVPEQPPDSASAPELEPRETETAWVTAPIDLGVAQQAGEPETPAVGAQNAISQPAATQAGDGMAAERAAALEAEARALATSVAATGAASLAAIESQVAQITEAVRAEAESARAQVVAAYEEQRAAVSSELEATLGAINQSRDQQHEAISAFAESERERLHTAKQTEEESATALAEQLKVDALATGDSEAQRADEGTEQRAERILAEAEAVGARGDPASVDAQREAARRIAQDAADKCRETGHKLASDVREEASTQSGKYDELLQDFLEKLGQAVADAEPSIDEFADYATELVTSRAEQALNAAEEIARQSSTALDNAQSAAEEQIQAWEEQAASAVSDAGNQLSSPLSAQIERLRTTLEAFGPEAAGRLRGMGDAPAEEVGAAEADARARLLQANDSAVAALADFDANTATQLNGLLEDLRSNLAASVSERTTAASETGVRMAQMLRDASQAAVAGMEEAVSSYQQRLATGMTAAIQKMTEDGAQFRSNLEAGHAAAMAKFVQLIDDGLASEDGFLTDARTEMASAVADIASEYETLKAEADQREASEEAAPATRIHRGIWDTITGWIDSVRRWFADTFGEFWGGLLFGILAALIIVAVGFLLAWAIGAIVAFFIASAEIAAIVTIVILLVIAIPLNIYNRFQEFYADHPGEDAGFWRGLGLVGLGIADLTGIPFIIEGIVGRRAFAPRDMTPFERGERLGMGLVFFGAALISIRGILRARPTPEIEPRPDPATGEIPKLPPPSPTRPMADVMQWGNGIEGIPVTRARIGTLTLAELLRGGVTRELAARWRDFYINESVRNPYNPATGRGNPQAAPRADLMRRAVDLLGTVPVTPVPVNPPRPAGDDDDDNAQRMPAPGTEQRAGVALLHSKAQTGISVGHPDDPYEKEADRVASQVVSGPATAPAMPTISTLAPGALVQSKPEVASEDQQDVQLVTAGEKQNSPEQEVEPKAEENDQSGNTQSQPGDEEDRLQKLARPAEGEVADEEAAGREIRHPNGGEPLKKEVRSQLEGHLGADLSDVRVHTGTQAATASSSLGARAFTNRNHIWLGQGERADDLGLMAHETTHVLQQGGVAQPGTAEAGGAAAPGAAAATTSEGSASVSSVASHGLTGAAQPLPEMDRIQGSFGHHDVSDVQVQVGGPAEQANEQLGARAYTSGNKIAFKQEPDLRLAAHEAAHVVQQRRGVHLKGGIGEAGDPYEQQADSAAEAVVKGTPAEPVLDQQPGSDTAGAGVQRECECGGNGCSSCQSDKTEEPVQMELEVTTEREKPKALANVGDDGGAGTESAKPADEEQAVPEKKAAKEEQAGEGAAAEETEASAEKSKEAAEESVGQQSEAQAAAPAAQAGETAETGRAQTDAQAQSPTTEAGANREAVEEDKEEKEKKPSGSTSETSQTETTEASMMALQLKRCDPPPPPPDRKPAEGEAPPPDPPPGRVEENVESKGPRVEDQSEGCGAERMAATVESAVPAEKASATQGAVSSESATAGGSSAPAAAGAKGGKKGGGAPERPVAGGGAAGGVEEVQETGQGMEANIGRAEDGRAEAVSAYESSKEALDAASSEATSLASFGASFPKPEGATEGDEKLRSEATQTLESFLVDGSRKLTDATSFAKETVPERVGAAAEAAKANVSSAAAESSGALSARIAQARRNAVAQASALRGHINSAHNTTVATIEAKTLAALDSVDANYKAAAKNIPEIEADQITKLSSLYAAGDRRYREIGPRIGNEATARGEYYAAHYDGCHIYDEDGSWKKDSFWDGYLTNRRADARMKASRDVAQGYKESLEKEANKQADESWKGFACDEQGVHRSAAAALATLDSQYQSTVEMLLSAQGQAITSAGTTRDQLLASADQALRSMLALLKTQEKTQLNTIDETKYLQIVAVEQTAHIAAAALQGTILQAANSLGVALRSVVTSLTSTPAPNPEALGGVLGRGAAQIDDGLGRLYESIASGLSGVEGQIASHGGQSAEVLTGIGDDGIAQANDASTGFSQTMAGLKKSGADTFGKLSTNHVSSVKQMTTTANTGFTQQVTSLKQSYKTLNGGVAGRFEQAAVGLEGGLRDSLKGMDTGKDSIPHYADEAASKEAPAWKSIVKWILIVAIILVVAFVIGPAVIAAVGTWAGSAAAGAVIGGAIVGAATGASIQMLNNWEQNRTWHEGVLKAAAIGFIGGALGGGAGFLIGKQVGSLAVQYGLTKITTKAVEIGANLASDAVLEIGTQLVTTGEVNWNDFGQSMLMSLATAGLGEIPGVKKLQARVQTHVETKLGGAPGGHPKVGAPEVHPEAGGVKPHTEVEGGAPHTGTEPETTTPHPETETAPHPQADEKVGTPKGESKAPHTEAEVKANADAKAAAGKSPRPEGGDAPHLDSNPDLPAKQRTDSELADATTGQKIGDEDHAIVARKKGDQIELWGCSEACGQLKGKIDDMLEALPPTGHEKLRSDLEALKAKVEQAEKRLSGGEKSKEIIAETNTIAEHFKTLGEQHATVGKAMNDPKAIAEGEGAKTGKPAVAEADLSKVEIGKRQVVDTDKIGTLKFDGDPDVIYVLRDKNTGAILKVGKTTGEGAPGRLDAYDLAARRLKLELELEVITIETPKGEKVELYEGRLRSQMEDQGHILPWDNTQNRLGHEGPGTPFEPLAGPSKAESDVETGKKLPSMREENMWNEKGNLVRKDGQPMPEWVRKNAAPTKEDIMRLAREYKGDIAAMAKAAGKAESSIRRLLAEHDIKAQDFR